MAVGAGEEREAARAETIGFGVWVQSVAGDGDGCAIAGTAAGLAYASAVGGCEAEEVG